MSKERPELLERMIPVARPWMDEREAEAARRVILSGWVTQGPEVAAFEREFADVVGASHACAVSSCTTALHLALVALNVGPGDEVVTVSHSFIATANAIRYCGALPVFVDVELETFNMDPRRLDAAVTPKTRAIIAVHQLGLPCDLKAILEIAGRRGIPVVEDAACAIGSEIEWDGRWEPIGRPRGAVACFSFHPRKLVSTGDGGMLTTNDAALDGTFRLLRHHGMSVPDTVRHVSPKVMSESYSVIGFNYRMTDIQAAVGREQLKRLPEIVAHRRALAARYRNLLQDERRIALPVEPARTRSNWQSFAVRLDPGLDRQAVMQRMLDEGISTRRGPVNAHEEHAYPDGTWRKAGSLERSEQAHATSVILPLYHQMTDADQDRVIDALRRACTRHA